MSNLSFNESNTSLNCNCGAVTVETSAWNSWTEWRQQKLRVQAENCAGCAKQTRKAVIADRRQRAFEHMVEEIHGLGVNSFARGLVQDMTDEEVDDLLERAECEE